MSGLSKKLRKGLDKVERFAKVFDILQQHSDKDFVARIIDAPNSPVLPTEDGRSVMTHRMALEVGAALGEDPGKTYVFPTVIRGDDGELVNYKDWKDAWPVAKARGDYIEFDDFESADWFERNWKVVWGHEPREDK